MRRSVLLLVPLIALTALRCAGPGEAADDPVTVEPGDLFHIAVGETVHILEPDGSVGARLTFEEIIEDSRCPIGVECVHAGEARIRMTVHDADDQTFRFETSIPGMQRHGVIPEEADQREASAYVFHLLRLDPYPTADRDAGGETPVAIFMVRFFTR